MQNEAKTNESRDKTDLVSFLFGISVFFGLLIGLIDTVMGIVIFRPDGFSSFWTMFLSFSAGAILLTTLYMITFVLGSISLRLLFRWGIRLYAVHHFVFMAWVVILAQSRQLIRISEFDAEFFISWILILAISTLFTAISVARKTFVKRLVSEPRMMKTVSSVSLMFVLVASVCFWFLQYPFQGLGLSPYGPYVLILIFLVLFLAMLRFFLRTGYRIWNRPVLITIGIVMILVHPLTMVFESGPQRKDGVTDAFSGKVERVILLTVDTLRPDYLSCYGGERLPTPNIDMLAEDGILFGKATTHSPWTLPTFATIMTGYHPSVHLVEEELSVLPDTLQTIAEALKNHGYRTAAVGDNTYLRAAHQFSQGFDDYLFFPRFERFIGWSLGSKLLAGYLDPEKYRTEATTTDLTDLSLAWIEKNREEHFFFWLHYFDPHHPYGPPQEFAPKGTPPESIGFEFGDLKGIRGGYFVPTEEEKEWIRRLYEGEVQYVDHSIGRLIQKLKALNLYEHSLIIFTSDHGEEFWEHGGVEHGHTLYEELMHVPFIVKMPASFDSDISRRFDERITLRSLLPTILDICEIEYADDYHRPSSLATVLKGKRESISTESFIGYSLLYYEERESVVFDETKYILFPKSGKEELYDLRLDPDESINLAFSHPERIRKAKAMLNAHHETAMNLRASLGISGNRRVELSGRALKKLQGLGYLK